MVDDMAAHGTAKSSRAREMVVGGGALLSASCYVFRGVLHNILSPFHRFNDDGDVDCGAACHGAGLRADVISGDV
jgi:hypothetical protein